MGTLPNYADYAETIRQSQAITATLALFALALLAPLTSLTGRWARRWVVGCFYVSLALVVAFYLSRGPGA